MNVGENTGPAEVWLSKRNLSVTCRVVFDNEAVQELTVRSLSMRGAQREITGQLINLGYEPAGRWSAEEEHGFETMRTFRRPAGQTISQQLGIADLERPLMENPGKFTRFDS